MHYYVLNSVPGDHPSQAEALSIIKSVNESLQANRDSFTEEDWDADDDAVQWKLDDMAYDAIPENLKMLDWGRDFIEGGGISWDIESTFYAGQMVDKSTWVLFQLLKIDDGLGWRFEHAADVSDPTLVFADLGSVFAKWLTQEDETSLPDKLEPKKSSQASLNSSNSPSLSSLKPTPQYLKFVDLRVGDKVKNKIGVGEILELRVREGSEIAIVKFKDYDRPKQVLVKFANFTSPE